MSFWRKTDNRLAYILRLAGWGMILMGIVMRLVLFFQDRNLIIDEANIVRNLYERNFFELLLPLQYEQYAPPVFLWIEELLSLLFGYGEKALKLYPLFCGFASLFVFRAIMKRFVPTETLWLPLGLLAFSPYLTEFSTTIKQYMPDILVVLLLIYLALKKDIAHMTQKQLLLYWLCAGSIAICASMPAVFALAGVWFYYAWQCVQYKKTNYLWTLLWLALLWLGVFGIYYLLILKPQIESNYLQDYHKEYFLHLIPKNQVEWQHNNGRIRELLKNAAGHSAYSYIITTLMVPLGIVWMARKKPAVLILFITPILLTLLAAALNQFSLIMRVSLFLLPLLMLFFSFGFGKLYASIALPFRILLLIPGSYMINTFNNLYLFSERYGMHEITAGFDYLNSKGVEGKHVCLHHASVPTYIYYTDIHPQRDRYKRLSGAQLLTWDTHYAGLTRRYKDTTYFVFTGGFHEEERAIRLAELNTFMTQVDYFEKYICFVYGFAPKNPDTAGKSATEN